jgi:hypothetical protein
MHIGDQSQDGPQRKTVNLDSQFCSPNPTAPPCRFLLISTIIIILAPKYYSTCRDKSASLCLTIKYPNLNLSHVLGYKGMRVILFIVSMDKQSDSRELSKKCTYFLFTK